MRDLTDAILSGVAPVFALLATPCPFALVAEHVSKWEDTGGTNPEEGISSRAVGDKNLYAGYQKWGIIN